MKHLTDKSGISLTNIQFSIYKVAVCLTNLHLGLLLSDDNRGTACENEKLFYRKENFENSKISLYLQRDVCYTIKWYNMYLILIQPRKEQYGR